MTFKNIQLVSYGQILVLINDYIMKNYCKRYVKISQNGMNRKFVNQKE